MAKAPPAFQFYAADWLVGTADLSHSSKATYLLLLCYEWTKINVQFDPPKLAKMIGISEQHFMEDWAELECKFTLDSTNCLRNEKLETIREEGLALREARAEAGRKGGLSKAKAKLKQKVKQKPSKGSMKYEVRSLKITQLQEVVSHYQSYHPRAKAGAKEESKINSRLSEGFSVDDLKLAIDGCHVSPFHCGQNADGQKYQSLELIVRDASKVTRFIELAGEEGGVALSERSRKSLNAINSWLSKQNGETL